MEQFQGSIHSDVIRISIPASVAADLGSFQKSIAELVGRLGCNQCASGRNCLFTIEKDFVVDPALNLRSIHPEYVRLPVDPIPIKQQDLATNIRPVSVTIPNKVSNDLDSLMTVVAKVAGKLGCEACCSGFDVLFRHEREFLINEALEINTL